jgi:hypothetical protein
LPPGTLASDVASAALRRGVSVATLDRYFVGPVTVEALILGYGATSLPQVRKAAAVLRELLTSPANSKTLRDCSSRRTVLGAGSDTSPGTILMSAPKGRCSSPPAASGWTATVPPALSVGDAGGDCEQSST